MSPLSQRFRPSERIREPGAFRKAFDRKRSASDAVLIVYAVENDLSISRLGVSVGKKKVKTAVGRNRIKRLLREAFRLNKHTLPTGLDFVVVPKGPELTFQTATSSFPHLAQSAARRLGRVAR